MAGGLACPFTVAGPNEYCLTGCLNGGVCDEDTGVCTCATGYVGRVCEHKVIPRGDCSDNEYED